MGFQSIYLAHLRRGRHAEKRQIPYEMCHLKALPLFFSRRKFSGAAEGSRRSVPNSPLFIPGFCMPPLLKALFSAKKDLSFRTGSRFTRESGTANHASWQREIGSMEIEFNPSRFAQAPGQKPAARSNAAPQPPTSKDVGLVRRFEYAVQEVSVIRPGQVERARALVANAQYPSAEMMDRVASLLATHLK
jgi:hypothetical protein